MKSELATSADIAELTAEMRVFTGTVTEFMRTNMVPTNNERNGGSVNVTFSSGPAVMAIGLGGFLVALVAVVMLSGRISDMRTDMQSDRIERKMHEIWAVQEANTMRTFAKTGVLAPMAPRPNPKEATK
jgi:hypothetical protein